MITDELPRSAPFCWPHMVQTAWLHDIIEDGRKADGSSVQTADLCAAGISPLVVEDVLVLTQRAGESEAEYIGRIAEAGLEAKLVKCCDRICNLREGRGMFEAAYWQSYIDETNEFVRPLVSRLANPQCEWLTWQLDLAIKVPHDAYASTPTRDGIPLGVVGSQQGLASWWGHQEDVGRVP
jgi:(p)ppGpp synthase/HD superfamily hydrolase